MRLTPLQSPPSRATESEIDHVIARTLAENRQTVARAAMPDIAPQDELLGLGGRNARRETQQSDAAAARLKEVARCHAPERATTASQVEDLRGCRTSFLERLGNLGPWPRRAAIAACVGAVAYLAPWVLPVAALAVVLLPLGLALLLGTDRVAGMLARVFHWLHARSPDRAERFRARVDRLATGMDTLLDRLPEHWTTGLYMPDFSREALLPGAGAQQPDPFERIAAEARGI